MRFIFLIIQYFKKFLFGHDIFISYSRKDSGNYAERLAIELQQSKYRCYIDRWDTKPSADLPPRLVRKLKLSSMLIVIGTKAATNSESISKEVRLFLKTNRIIVPVDLGYLREANWYSNLIGLPPLIEKDANRESECPSNEVKESIVQAFTYQKLNNRQRIAVILTFAILLFLIMLIGISAQNLSRLQSKSASITSENERLVQINKVLEVNANEIKERNSNLNTDNQKLSNINRQLKESNDLAGKNLAIQIANNTKLKKANNIALNNLEEKRKLLEEITSNLKLSNDKVEINENLAKSILADAQNVPTECHYFANKAYEIEHTNKIPSYYSSMLLSKAENRGIAKTIKTPNSINEFEQTDSAIYYLNYKDSVLQKVNLNGLPDKKIRGKFIGLEVPDKTNRLFTCQVHDEDQQIELLELNKDLQLVNKTVIIDKSDFLKSFNWSSITECYLSYIFSDISPDLCLKFINRESNCLIYEIYFNLSKFERRAVRYIIPKPVAYNDNLVKPTYFIDTSRSIFELNGNLYLNSFTKGIIKEIKGYNPGSIQLRGDDLLKEEYNSFSYDKAGLIAYSSNRFIEFITINGDNCRFNKLFKVPEHLWLLGTQFIEEKKLLLVLKDNDAFFIDVLRIDTSTNYEPVIDFRHSRAELEKDKYNNEYYKMENLGNLHLNQKTGISAIFYDYPSASIIIIGKDGAIEIVNLTNNRNTMLYGAYETRFLSKQDSLGKAPIRIIDQTNKELVNLADNRYRIVYKGNVTRAGSNYNVSSEKLISLIDTSTLEIWEMTKHLPYPIQFFDDQSVDPGMISSLCRVYSLNYSWRLSEVIGVWNNNEDEYLVNLSSNSGVNEKYVSVYKNKKYITAQRGNTEDCYSLIANAAFLCIQEGKISSMFSSANNGKIISYKMEESRLCRLFYMDKLDSLSTSCSGQLCGQSF